MEKKAKKAKKGFTMIELVVATAVAAVLTLALVSVIAPVYRTYQRTLARADAGVIAGNVMDSIRSGAGTASIVAASSVGDSDAVDISRGLYAVQDGQLYFFDPTQTAAKATPVFDAAYYNGKTIELKTKQVGYNSVQVQVTVSGNGLDLFTDTCVVSPLRNVLDAESRFTAAGMYETAKAVIHSSSGETPQEMTASILGDVYGGSFPVYPVSSIIAENKLQALLAAATDTGMQDYYKALLDPNKTFYVATYVTEESYPIIYLTDWETGYSVENPSVKAYMVYYNGVWYVHFPVGSTVAPTHFDKMDAAELAVEMQSTDKWRTVSSLSRLN